MLLRRDLDEAQSSEQENSLNGKQGVTNAMGAPESDRSGSRSAR